ncbi:MAG: HAD family hydrolase [Clostridiales bacterium]|nr:HAD family hydrolase [Clostridiales bacterium]
MEKTLKTGVIFDLDGTLWNSVREVAIAWNDTFKKYGVGIELTPDMMRITMGRTVPEIGEAMPVLRDIEPKRRAVILKECCDEENRRLNLFGGVLYDGVPEVLEELEKSYELFIVSNCEDGYIESFLNYHKTAKFFKDTECIGRTGLNKAGNIRLVIERNGLEKAVYVGDTERDMRSARDAGVPFIHAAYGFGSGFDAEMRVSSFRELPDLLTKVFEV